jgi:hypothetical protein
MIEPTISQQSNLHYMRRKIWIFCSPLDEFLISAGGGGLFAGLWNGCIHFHKGEWKVGSNGTMQCKLKNQFQNNLQSVAGELARGKHGGH